MQFAFGAGNMYVTQLNDAFGNTILNPTPYPLAVLQEGVIDITSDLKELFGQSSFPVAAARGKTKVTMKVKPARILAGVWNAIFFGQPLSAGYVANATDTVGFAVPTTLGVTSAVMAGGAAFVVGDTITVVGGTKTITATLLVTSVTAGNATTLQVTNPGSYTVAPTAIAGTNGNNVFTGAVGVGTTGVITVTTLAQSFTASPPVAGTAAAPAFGAFAADLGQFYAATGLPLIRVSGVPVSGQYSVNVGTGVYTFAAADAGLVIYNNFQYTVAANLGQRQIVQNVTMGFAPAFRCDITVQYLGKLTNFQLYKCIATKMGMGFKNEDFAVPEFDVSAFDNGAGNVFGWSVME